MKKFLALLLTAMLALGMVNMSAFAEEETVTLTLFHNNASTIPSNILDNPVMNQITEKTGVVIDWSPYMGGGGSGEVATRLMAAEEYPDIWIMGDTQIIQKLIEYDLVMPLDELIEKAPNVKEVAGRAIAFANYSFDTEESYMIPTQVGGVNWYHNGYDYVFNYRYDLWVEAGKPELKTTDDFIAFLKKCKELEPVNYEGLENYGTGINLATETWYIFSNLLKGNATTNYGHGIWHYDTYEYEPAYVKDSLWYDSVKFYNELMQEGLMDPESATMKIDQTEAKGKSYRYFFGVTTWQTGFMNDNVRGKQKEIAEKVETGEELTEWDERIAKMGWVPVVLNYENPNGNTFARGKTTYGNGSYYLISKTCKDPEAAMRFIDYLASFEGAELCANGPEGYNWEMRDGVPHWFSADEREAQKAEGKEFLSNKELGISYVAPLLQVNGIRENPNGWPTIYFQASNEQHRAGQSQGEKDFCDENGYAYGMQYIDDNFLESDYDQVVLDLVTKIDPTSDLAMVNTNVNSVKDEYLVRLIYAETDEEFDKLWDEFVVAVEDAGVQELYDYYDAEIKAAIQKKIDGGF